MNLQIRKAINVIFFVLTRQYCKRKGLCSELFIYKHRKMCGYRGYCIYKQTMFLNLILRILLLFSISYFILRLVISQIFKF
jgi:hypothetical protein